jgi:hypothetical protein
MELVISILAGILLIIWLIYFYLYSTQLIQLSKTKEMLHSLYSERKNELPLLMMIVKPHIVKSEEVFSKAIHLRHELLFNSDSQKEETLQEQIVFILTVADHHPELVTNPAYQKIKAMMLSLNSQIEQYRQRWTQQKEQWQDIHRKSLFCLFPGYFFIHPPCFTVKP